MAKTKQKTRPLPISVGPGKAALRRAVCAMIDRDEYAAIPLFGTSYRQYPVRITTIEMVKSNRGSETLFNIKGTLDWKHYETCPPSMEGVIIKGYSPHFRTAQSALFPV